MVQYNVDLTGKTILVTGAAGFIGSNLAFRLLKEVKDVKVVGIDNMNDYYDVHIKEERLRRLQEFDGFTMVYGSIADKAVMDKLFEEHQPKVVVNLAAQAGVRYSITNPDAYVQSNLIGFYNILEACRHHEVEHLVYASSSSVYGSNKKVPYSTDDKVDNPVSLYAATKKSNELMAHAYSKLYNIPSTGLRFFTVYGPAGRPDMAYFGFTNKLVKGDTIKIFNYGNCKRDFTYVDDIVEGIMRVMQHAPEKQNGEDGLPIPPYKVYNIGNSHPENLLEFVSILQEELIRAGVLPEDYDFEAHKELVAMQPGDVPVTYADTTPLEEDFGYKPATPLREGLRAFAEWYKEYYCEGSQSLSQGSSWLITEVLLQRSCIGISHRHIARLHCHQFLMRLKVIVLWQHTGTNQFLLQDAYKLQQVLRMRVADIVNLVWRDRQTVLTILLLRRMLHHSHDTLHDVIHVSEVTLAVTIVENLDGITLHQFVGKAEVRHVRSSSRSIHREESQTRTWNIIEL